jgi:hypothetical protein
MRFVATAKAAILAELQPVRRLSLVFLRVVIAALALSTGKNHHHARLFLCHQ